MIRRIALGLILGVSFAGSAAGQQVFGTCQVFPSNNIWNTPVDTLPVLPNSTSMVNTIGAAKGFHADFGSGVWNGGPIGIPFVAVPGSQTKYSATFLYWDESDTGPYAVPLNAPIEGGSNSTADRHAIAIDTTNCVLYELYRAFPQSSSWVADSGAIFDLKSNALRPATWTSADAAGLPIVPGLITYPEVISGEIKHAIRFTVPQTRGAFVWPARHSTSSLTGTQYPRMGERFRLKASVEITPYPPDVQVILRAMKKYGIIVADNGSSWYISGQPDPRWNDTTLHSLEQLLGSNFEAVDATLLRINPDSGAAIQNGVTVQTSPASASLRVGFARTFTAAVSGASGGVEWSVNDIAGGDAVVGTISSTGQYIAPTSVPSPATVTVRAKSLASPASSGSSMVTILPHPSITSVSPAPVRTGSFTITVKGSGFVGGSSISFDGAALTTTFVSSSKLTATGNAPAPKTAAPVVVRTPDGDVSNTVFVDVAPAAAVTITISPAAATVRVGRRKLFTATVQNTSNRATIWKVNGIVGGNATVGTINSAGRYRAPAVVPQPSIVTVSATAVADQTKVASASVTITN